MAEALSAIHVTKSFPGVKALEDVSLELHAGEVHALIGENGAGKSTLISILAGASRPDSGEVQVAGHAVAFDSPGTARRHGISTIFQELSLQPWLDVASNIVLGNEPSPKGARQLLSRRQAEQVAQRALDRLGARDISVRTVVGRLTSAQRQLVEIARALALGAPVIIMDEPTSSLPSRDASRLLEIVRQLRDEGTAILYVSHRLDEIKSIADRVTILRDGRNVRTELIDDLTTGQMIESMTGRRVDHLFPERSSNLGEVVFRAKDLTRSGDFRDVSFEVRSGEILGFAGLIGAGRSEVMRAIFGADRLDSGHIELDGKTISVRSPREAIAAGIYYLPEDRKEQGLVLDLSSRENMVMAALPRFSALGLVRGRQVRSVTAAMGRKLGVKGDLNRPSLTLSGGNQQKVVIGKGLISHARLLIFDEPTRGIDVGAKYEIYALIHELAAQGVAIILVSSDLPEIMNVPHRVIVMSDGQIHGEFVHPELSEEAILSAAFSAFTSEQGAA
jgi:ABC-type sugar transport system ATPase subunit